MLLIYKKKSVGPRIEAWETPALSWYSCKDLPTRTTQRHLILREKK